jgi:iron(II)-dependent oxidoreductase
MVRINGGEFRMGRDLVRSPVDGPPVLQPEMPASEAIVPGFYLDATEVTNAEFTEFLKVTHHEDWASEIWPGVGHYHEAHSKWPVTHVKYEQALAYAAWRGCRLPTEHELEFVARTGDGRTVPKGLVGDPSRTGSSTLELHAVDADPLDVSRPGSEAIHGLFGNASELTLFHYRPYPSLRFLRVRNDAWNGIAVRSGWISGGEILPTAPRLLGDLGRASQLPSQASVHVGFRCARSVRPWTETGPPHFKIQE